MSRKRFLTETARQDLLALARDASAAHGLARRANAIILLDRGMSCVEVGRVLLIDDDTVRSWHKLYQDGGLEGLAELGYLGSECRLNKAQQSELKAWVGETLPRTSREVGSWIEAKFGVEYRARSAVIALLHRLGMEHRRPHTVARKLDPGKRHIHLFLDNARYHHSWQVKEWLATSECRIKLHFIPPYCPHLNPIERLWGLMHRNITHTRTHNTIRDFAKAVLDFLRTEVPQNWRTLCDHVSDNFRVINPADFRVIS